MTGAFLLNKTLDRLEVAILRGGGQFMNVILKRSIDRILQLTRGACISIIVSYILV